MLIPALNEGDRDTELQSTDLGLFDDVSATCGAAAVACQARQVPRAAARDSTSGSALSTRATSSGGSAAKGQPDTTARPLLTVVGHARGHVHAQKSNPLCDEQQM